MAFVRYDPQKKPTAQDVLRVEELPQVFIRHLAQKKHDKDLSTNTAKHALSIKPDLIRGLKAHGIHHIARMNPTNEEGTEWLTSGSFRLVAPLGPYPEVLSIAPQGLLNVRERPKTLLTPLVTLDIPGYDVKVFPEVETPVTNPQLKALATLSLAGGHLLYDYNKHNAGMLRLSAEDPSAGFPVILDPGALIETDRVLDMTNLHIDGRQQRFADLFVTKSLNKDRNLEPDPRIVEHLRKKGIEWEDVQNIHDRLLPLVVFASSMIDENNKIAENKFEIFKSAIDNVYKGQVLKNPVMLDANINEAPEFKTDAALLASLKHLTRDEHPDFSKVSKVIQAVFAEAQQTHLKVLGLEKGKIRGIAGAHASKNLNETRMESSETKPEQAALSTVQNRFQEALRPHLPRGISTPQDINDILPFADKHKAIWAYGKMKDGRPGLRIGAAADHATPLGNGLQTIKALALTFRNMGLEIIKEGNHDIAHRYARPEEREPENYRVTLAPAKSAGEKGQAAFDWLLKSLERGRTTEAGGGRVANWQEELRKSRRPATPEIPR